MDSAQDEALTQYAPLPKGTEERSLTWTKGQKWRLGIGLAVGALLLFCDWTDYSPPGIWPDYLLPIFGIAAGVMALRASKYVPRTTVRRAAKVVAVATLVEGAATALVAAIMAIMSFGGIVFVTYAILGEEQISSVVSPDGTRVAEEYYVGGGALSDGLLIVRVKHRLIPLMERDIYRGGSISSDHVLWEDNNTLYIPGADRRIHLGLIRAELATPIQLGITAWELAGVMEQTNKYIEEGRKRDEEMSRPLKTIPIYPGGTENDNSGANMNGGGGFRAFDIKAPNSDEAAKWYKQVLSEGKWRVVDMKRRETRGETAASNGEVRLVYNCIDTVRSEEDGTSKHYYWRFRWNEQSTDVRVIVETPDPPTVNDCN